MTGDDVRWDQYPAVASTALEDFLRFLAREAVPPEEATRAQVDWPMACSPINWHQTRYGGS